MYNILEQLKYCRIIHVVNLSNENKEYFKLNGASIKIGYNLYSSFPINKEFIDETKSVYQNMTIIGNNYELQILQSEGQGCIDPPDDYEVLPNELLFRDSNICWFNGYIGLLSICGDIVKIVKLQKAKKFDMNNIRGKRPYSYNLCSKKNETYICIYINYWNNNISLNIEHKEYIIKLNIKRSELFTSINIQNMINFIRDEQCPNNWVNHEYENEVILTRDWLAANGWNLKDGIWKKGHKAICDTLEEIADLKYNGKSIFFVKDIK